MKTVAASTFLFAGLALAVPAVQKRDVATEVVVKTVWTTTTQYVNPPTPNAFFEKNSASAAPAASTPPAAAPPAAPAPASAPAAVAAPAPVVAPVVQPAAQPAVQAPQPVAAAPATGGGPAGTGDGTFYDVSVGLGSCGTQASNSDPVVALATSVMQNGANPNSNPLCGKPITITYGGVTHVGRVYDTCQGCKAGDVDLSTGWFKEVFPNGDGRVSGVSWVIG